MGCPPLSFLNIFIPVYISEELNGSIPSCGLFVSSCVLVVSSGCLWCCVPKCCKDISLHEKGTSVVKVLASLNLSKGDTKPPISMIFFLPIDPSVTQQVVRITFESQVAVLIPHNGGPAFHTTIPVGGISSGMGGSGSGM